MIIFGIETSCDETAASVIKDGREILSHVVASSAEMHIKSGGVIPEHAAREQVKSIIPVIKEALVSASGVGGWKIDDGPEKSNALISNIDAIAVTAGPGLIGSLLVGVETAKTLAAVWNKPIVPVNHLVAHIYANWLLQESGHSVQGTGKIKEPKLPGVALVVSGGHTDLVLMQDHGKLEWIGGTRDDAAGEAFDKTARLLGLTYPGGPSISKAASNYQLHTTNYELHLPRPMIDENNFDFSFSGLKTATIRAKEENPNIPVEQFAYEIQEAITDVLVEKTLRAVKKYNVATLLLAGGVAANSRLREKFEFKISNLKFKINFCVPPPHLCTDNASYIAACAEHIYTPVPWYQVKADPELQIMTLPALR